MSAASRLSSRLRGFDAPVNALHDRLNAGLGGLWWPLDPPRAERPLGASEHALYAAHIAIAMVVASLLPLPRRRSIGALALVGAGSWVVFTGAWDRRAAAYAGASTDSSARRSR